jgi:hypothetical protein
MSGLYYRFGLNSGFRSRTHQIDPRCPTCVPGVLKGRVLHAIASRKIDLIHFLSPQWTEECQQVTASIKCPARHYCGRLNKNPLHLIHRHFIIPPIVQCRRPRRLIGRHLLGELAPALAGTIHERKLFS